MKELSIEEKELIFKDLSARLRYGVILHIEDIADSYDDKFTAIGINHGDSLYINGLCVDNNGYDTFATIKSYLRPLSSMTEEEKEELNCLCYHNIGVQDERICGYICADEMYDVIDWLNKNMFDYRGLIPKGLALVAPEGMYKID